MEVTFQKFYILFGVASILIVAISGIVVIYTSFKITFSERIKESGMLSSIGMDKSQRKDMIRKEANIVGFIGIPLGILLGLSLSRFIIYILNRLIIETIDHRFSIITFDSSIEICMKVSLLALLLSAVIVYIITFISSVLPMKKLNKISVINAMKNVYKTKVTSKQVKIPKFIEKIFKEEGVIAYKNIRRDKARYKTIVISVIISIILFLTVSGFISNFYGNRTQNYYNDYTISMTKMEGTNYQENKDKLLELLNNSGLINEYYISESPFQPAILQLEREMVNDEFKKLPPQKEDNSYTSVWHLNNGGIKILVSTYTMDGKAYDDLLSRVGISELKDGEVIVANKISEKTKYGKNISITNFKIGDTYTLNISGKDKTFKIVGILDNFAPYTYDIMAETPQIYQIVNKKTMNNMSNNFSRVFVNIDTDKPFEIDTLLKNYITANLNKNYGASGISGTNNFEKRVSEENQKTITKIIAYSFVGLIFLVTVINIFSTIYSSILLRKKDFAVLKSMGMSNKQIRKMMFLEGIFYGGDSIIYGSLISIAILYIMYIFMINTKLYYFSIPWKNIGICAFVIYVCIFTAIANAIKKIKDKNIIDEVRNENI